MRLTDIPVMDGGSARVPRPELHPRIVQAQLISNIGRRRSLKSVALHARRMRAVRALAESLRASSQSKTAMYFTSSLNALYEPHPPCTCSQDGTSPTSATG